MPANDPSAYFAPPSAMPGPRTPRAGLADLTPDELQELDLAVTPRILELLLKAFPQFGDTLGPLIANAGQTDVLAHARVPAPAPAPARAPALAPAPAPARGGSPGIVTGG